MGGVEGCLSLGFLELPKHLLKKKRKDNESFLVSLARLLSVSTVCLLQRLGPVQSVSVIGATMLSRARAHRCHSSVGITPHRVTGPT